MSLPPSPPTIALISGANRGLGLEVGRQLAQAGITTLLGSRNLQSGKTAAAPLIDAGLAVLPHQLDITDGDSITRLTQAIADQFGRLDILINNAGSLYDSWQTASTADLAVVQAAFNTNTLGAWRLTQACLPLLKRSSQGRIVNVSSGAGALASMGAGTPAYSTSKAALNAFTRLLAAELQDSGILVNAVCPGWVATDMGGSGGRPVAAGAAGIVWAATLPAEGPTGGFFRDGSPIAW